MKENSDGIKIPNWDSVCHLNPEKQPQRLIMMILITSVGETINKLITWNTILHQNTRNSSNVAKIRELGVHHNLSAAALLTQPLDGRWKRKRYMWKSIHL